MSPAVSFCQLRHPRRRTIGIVGGPVPGILSPPYAVLSTGDGEYNIWLVSDGVPTKITPYAEDGNVDSLEMVYPVLSPDKTRIAYRGKRLSDSAETLYGVNWNGGTPSAKVVLTVSGHRMMHPMWHPDSDQIVYGQGTAFAFGGSIELTDWSGAGPTTLYTPASGFRAYRPQFNYDGTLIAFWLDKDSSVDASEGLYVMDADGSNVTQIKAINGPYRFDGAQFAWARTQNVICFDNNTDDKVYVINADGTGETLVGVGEIDTNAQISRVSKYAWAADDSLIYIASRWFDGSSLVWRPYSLQPDGSGVTRLNDTHGPFNQQYATNLFFSPWDDRIYFEEVYGTAGAGKYASIAADGSDYRVEHLLSDEPELNQFSSGTGFEYT